MEIKGDILLTVFGVIFGYILPYIFRFIYALFKKDKSLIPGDYSGYYCWLDDEYRVFTCEFADGELPVEA